MMQKYFCLTNDPDHGLYKDYNAIFKQLTKQGIFTTTAVFCTLKDDGSYLSKHCSKKDTSTIENKDYQKLMLWARDMGHEIAYHGYSQVSDTRDEFQKGIDIFKRVFGDYPTTFIEHGSHPLKHPIERCKRDNLAYQGSLEGTDFYIKDIVRSAFKCTWTHDFLLDNIFDPMNLKDLFLRKDDIVYFKRWRNRDIEPLFSKMDQVNNTIIGYTHFGYKGYKSRREKLLFWERQKYPFENWLGRDSYRTSVQLSNLLQKHNIKSVTLNQLYNIAHEA